MKETYLCVCYVNITRPDVINWFIEVAKFHGNKNVKVCIEIVANKTVEE